MTSHQLIITQLPASCRRCHHQCFLPAVCRSGGLRIAIAKVPCPWTRAQGRDARAAGSTQTLTRRDTREGAHQSSSTRCYRPCGASLECRLTLPLLRGSADRVVIVCSLGDSRAEPCSGSARRTSRGNVEDVGRRCVATISPHSPRLRVVRRRRRRRNGRDWALRVHRCGSTAKARIAFPRLLFWGTAFAADVVVLLQNRRPLLHAIVYRLDTRRTKANAPALPFRLLRHASLRSTVLAFHFFSSLPTLTPDVAVMFASSF